MPTRYPQQASSDSIFKKCADSTRSTRVQWGCTWIKALTTVSHCHDWRSWKLRLLQLYLTQKQAWKGNPKKNIVSPSTSDVTPTSICSLFTLLVSIPCSNISQLHVLSISVQCPHVHNTLGWLDILPIICSASFWQRRWRWQRAVLCENTAGDVKHATSLKITLTVFFQLVPNFTFKCLEYYILRK